ncbi:MAG: hypothetical protein E6J90_46105 [Deltaproteobacteria bacterium]|nr:MAG: hypothetical protein E6J90_46105 [Deltaproteobacteria bacterium]TMQ14886.1 MAG: hypothetical protein E6J91_14345 [Deltaproteobacteria bacterium]
MLVVLVLLVLIALAARVDAAPAANPIDLAVRYADALTGAELDADGARGLHDRVMRDVRNDDEEEEGDDDEEDEETAALAGAIGEIDHCADEEEDLDGGGDAHDDDDGRGGSGHRGEDVTAGHEDDIADRILDGNARSTGAGDTSDTVAEARGGVPADDFLAGPPDEDAVRESNGLAEDAARQLTENAESALAEDAELAPAEGGELALATDGDDAEPGALAMLDAELDPGEPTAGADASAAASTAGAAEVYEQWMRHRRPSPWGRLDVGVAWRCRWSEPMHAPANRYNEIWLVATWRR